MIKFPAAEDLRNVRYLPSRLNILKGVTSSSVRHTTFQG